MIAGTTVREEIPAEIKEKQTGQVKGEALSGIKEESNSGERELIFAASNLGDKKITDEQKSSFDSQQIPKSLSKRMIFSKGLEIKQQNGLIPSLEKDILKKPLRNKDNYINLSRNIETQFSKVEIKPSLPETTISESIPKEILYEFIEKAYFHLKNGKSEIHIRLKPEYLGKLELRITQQNGKINAKFIVESFELKELIESEFDSLKKAMIEKGFDLESIEVHVGMEPGRNLEGRHQMYADNIKILSEYGKNDVQGEDDEYENWVNVDINGNKLFWFISKIDLIA